MRIAICRSSDELRHFYENTVKFTRVVATSDILAANPCFFEWVQSLLSPTLAIQGAQRSNVYS